MRKLENFNILDVPHHVVSEVASMVATAKKMCISVGWIDKVLRVIDTKGDHFTLLREARLLRVQLEELQEHRGQVG